MLTGSPRAPGCCRERLRNGASRWGVSVCCLAAGLSHDQTILDHVTALQSVLYIRRNQSSYPVPVPSSAITDL